MTPIETGKILDNCVNPDSGCFKDDTEAFDYLRGLGGDAGLHANHLAVACAAAEAGSQGTPLNEVTYRPFIIQGTEDWVGGSADETRLSVLEQSEDPIDKMHLRIAKCAHVCGQKALAGCPLGYKKK